MLGRRLAGLAIMSYVLLYRRSSGSIGGHLRGMPVLLLTTTGRRSGKKRTVPVMYLQEGSSYVVTASNNGRPQHPAWWLNLKTSPHTVVQVKGDKRAVMAEQLAGEDRARLWRQLIGQAPFFEGYQKRTTREIPVVRLRPTEESHDR